MSTITLPRSTVKKVGSDAMMDAGFALHVAKDMRLRRLGRNVGRHGYSAKPLKISQIRMFSDKIREFRSLADALDLFPQVRS